MTKTAAIFGNSQAGVTGAMVEDLLRADGWHIGGKIVLGFGLIAAVLLLTPRR